jgi:hypothetical protein
VDDAVMERSRAQAMCWDKGAGNVLGRGPCWGWLCLVRVAALCVARWPCGGVRSWVADSVLGYQSHLRGDVAESFGAGDKSPIRHEVRAI